MHQLMYLMSAPTPTHHTAVFRSALAALASSNVDTVIIQRGHGKYSRFYVYQNAERLDADAACFTGKHCREIIREVRRHELFVDVDSHAMDAEAVAEHIAATTGTAIESVDVLRSVKGYHVYVRGLHVNATEHRAYLSEIARVVPDVDVKPTTGIRLPGSQHDSGQQDLRIDGRKLSETLACGFDAPVVPEHEREVQIAGDIVVGRADADKITREVSKALSGAEDTFVVRDIVGTRVMLDRVSPSPCSICGCTHDHDNAYYYINHWGGAIARCHRGDGSRVLRLEKNLLRAAEVAGPEESRDLCETYRADTCVSVPGDYLDASACGLGKSKAAWTDILQSGAESIVCVSYRIAFTEKTRADYAEFGLRSYREKQFEKKTIKLSETPRLVVQYESLKRVQGTPDVLLVDEWHGIRRQMFSSNGGMNLTKNKHEIRVFFDMVAAAKRVIVLDADLNDRDYQLFSSIRAGEMKFIANSRLPHLGKELIKYDSHQKNFAALKHMLATTDEKIAVYLHWASAEAENPRFYSVEGMARELRMLGIPYKKYNAKVGQDERAKDFSDVSEAFKDCRVVIYNNAVEAGVSIELQEFKTLFVMSMELGSVEATKQAIHRFRNVQTIHYSSEKPGFQRSAGPTTYDELELWLSASKADRQLLAVKSREFELFQYNAFDLGDLAGSPGAFAFKDHIIEAGRSATYFSGRLLKQMGILGFKMRRADAVEIPQVATTAHLADELDQQNWAERIEDEMKNATVHDQLEDFKGTQLSTDQIALADGLYLRDLFKVPESAITAEFVQKWQKLIPTYRRWRDISFMVEQSMSTIPDDYKRVRGVTSATEQYGMLRQLLEPLGLALTGGSVSASSVAERMQRDDVPDLLRQAVRVFPGLQKVSNETTRKGTESLKKILLHCGYEMKPSNKKNPSRGDYTLSSIEWPEMSQ